MKNSLKVIILIYKYKENNISQHPIQIFFQIQILFLENLCWGIKKKFILILVKINILCWGNIKIIYCAGVTKSIKKKLQYKIYLLRYIKLYKYKEKNIIILHIFRGNIFKNYN